MSGTVWAWRFLRRHTGHAAERARRRRNDVAEMTDGSEDGRYGRVDRFKRTRRRPGGKHDARGGRASGIRGRVQHNRGYAKHHVRGAIDAAQQVHRIAILPGCKEPVVSPPPSPRDRVMVRTPGRERTRRRATARSGFDPPSERSRCGKSAVRGVGRHARPWRALIVVKSGCEMLTQIGEKISGEAGRVWR